MRPPTAQFRHPTPSVLAGSAGLERMLNMFNDSIILPEKLLSVEDLSRILGLGPKSLYQRLCKDPSLLPPRFHIPGSRLVRFHPVTVRIWMDRLAGLTSTPSLPSPPPAQRGPGRPRKSEVIERERKGKG